MSEADMFRQFAAEAQRGSSLATNHDEKLALVSLASIWTQAALMSDRVSGSFGSSFTPLPRPVDDEAAARARS
jgi:hypothetical protein